ncbi:NAD(P)H-hydrate dehydratase [Candidatus Woesearchaeota archaeon CG10_big_fil_rev_8_21_14_0_10_34_8]|nr:MAG: NAD(P)H-hydrate dehydratase [Candidatus Woesearchaeota archaeon CG10_big_fil_rev_8_21_14_0_10_34_8]
MKYITKQDVKKLKLPKRDPKTKKGDFGKVLLVGGSPDYVGALALAGIAALRSGVDIVTVVAPAKVAWALNTLAPDLITKKYDCMYFDKKHAKAVARFAKDFDCVLIGNGIGRRSHLFCIELIKQLSAKKKPIVIDADAIKAISLKDVKGAILTPHKREFLTLLENTRIRKLQLKKHINDNVIVIKGNVDVIYSKEKIKYNKTGNPAMTVGGTGDILAGLAAGFYAQTNDSFGSAMAAAYINGLCGDVVRGDVGAGLIASDMLKKLAYAIDETFGKKKK